MDIKLAYSHSTDDELYLNQLHSFLLKRSSLLLDFDIWDEQFILSNINKKIVEIGARSPISFQSLPEIAKAKLKVYWVNLLEDEQNNSRSIIERRRAPMRFLNEQCENIFGHFKVTCIADIEHPEFPNNGFENATSQKSHNKPLLNFFMNWSSENRRDNVQLNYTQSNIKNNKVSEKKYKSPRITVLGDLHKKIVIQREQFRPLEKRNIIKLRHLYSTNETRFKENKKLYNSYLNFYRYPKWMRKATRLHVLEKINLGELAPSTLMGYYQRFLVFRDFLYEKYDSPAPELITSSLVEDEYIAWGNNRQLKGKNWYTDTVATLLTASRLLPDEWPKLSLSPRSANKINNVHYKKGLGRIGYNQEGAGRSYSKRIIDEIASHLNEAAEPISLVYAIILSTGMRAEDGHAVLFDCLSDDPNDNNFMLLNFWQNKVNKWNTKPLLKEKPEHAFLIKLIQTHQKTIIHKYDKPTKQLFPSFKGQTEYYLDQSWTRHELKKLCVKHNILNDDGKPLDFSWHPLRHTKGTSMAEEGHDILTIMMELGHTSPDMATVYVNKRLSLKKKALMEKGNGYFYTIEGQVDDKVGELLLKKNDLVATRVCGGACTLPNQLGDWCAHANACFTCKYFRADDKDIDYFKVEMQSIIAVIEEQENEILTHEKSGRKRMTEIVQRRTTKNKNTVKKLNNIIEAIEIKGQYQGTQSQQIKLDL